MSKLLIDNLKYWGVAKWLRQKTLTLPFRGFKSYHPSQVRIS